MKFKINVNVGDFKPSSRTMTDKGLLCRDAVMAIGDQVREYHHSELNLPVGDGKLIKVFTPVDALFDDDLMKRLEGSDFVDGHPAGNKVNPKNWRKHTIGTASNIRRDGNKLIGDLLVKDERAIKSIESNKKVGLSIGYQLFADGQEGKTADGKDYSIVVTKMIGDHVALVGLGRGGHEVRIGDQKLERKMRKITLANGMTFEVEGENLEAFEQGLKAQNDEYKALKDKADGEVTIGESTFKTSDVVAIQAAFDAIAKQKTDAETEAADLKANAIQPGDVEKLAAERSEVVTKAKSLKADIDDKGKSVEDIKSEAVSAHAGDVSVVAILAGLAIGDAAPAQINTAFDVLVATRPTAGKINANAGDSATAKALQNLNAPANVDAMALINQAKSDMYK